MIAFLLILLIIWALGSYILWGVMSRSKGGVIDIGWRDRGIALFWLPLLGWFLFWGLLCWAFRKGACA